jgi:uncharacterized protein (DUF433 family)
MATPAKGAVESVKSPGVRGGKPRIDGTRVCVGDVVRLHKSGAAPEQILADLHLTPGQVQAALSYYHSHAGEIEAPSPLRRRRPKTTSGAGKRCWPGTAGSRPSTRRSKSG